ncbi:FMN-dependent NADH-azoreductase [Flagellimonas nanhaiensis]|uniref:FMN dependent NADH:quinone oxidoreductase n=1 Tax=Flagellimonas nanhaiensis TaxID=2292706 RepID=A0A371JL07_9FLAO|nr:NAD(P)H-dependent oxidoreductase [Allomuricauda nanhaiensis]RDY57645.1 FMN-dependent NADH-azoreductase [Allomuricauda nanhaiensis]
MKTLLRIDCSSRVEGSHSRELADYFEQKWLEKHEAGKVVRTDLAEKQIPHLHNNTIEGFYTPTEYWSPALSEATAVSDELIQQLKEADELLISSPLYNYNVPSNLKAYFDQVVRIGHTFGINDGGYFGLLEDKIAFIITVKGGVYKGTDMERYDFQEPYLEAVLGHMGIKVQQFFSLEGTANKDTLDKNRQEVQALIDELFKN